MWVATQDLPRSAAHPFYTRLNQILDEHDFDKYAEGLWQRFTRTMPDLGCCQDVTSGTWIGYFMRGPDTSFTAHASLHRERSGLP